MFHIVRVQDYHEFDLIADAFVSRKVKCFEYGFGDDSMYWGVVYEGKKPTNADVDLAMRKAGFVSMDDGI